MHNKWCGNPKNGIIAKNVNANRQKSSSLHVLHILYIVTYSTSPYRKQYNEYDYPRAYFENVKVPNNDPIQ